MGRVMAVSFERYGRLYYLDPGAGEFSVGDKVLVPTEGGPEVAECVWAPEWSSEVADAGLPVCAGRAQPADLERDARHRRRRAETKLVAKRLIKQHELAMKVVGVDYLAPGAEQDELTVVYFTAPHRVDFRGLVGELARALRSRVDLRQVGARDAARITGGLGSCGRDLCCATFLTDLEPVGLRLAKAQDLPANPMRISGACGRLMCCLKYEHPLYVDFARRAPAVGARVSTDAGEGTVVGHAVPADEVVVRLRDSGAVTHCAVASVCGSRQGFQSRGTPGPTPSPRDLAEPPADAVPAPADPAVATLPDPDPVTESPADPSAAEAAPGEAAGADASTLDPAPTESAATTDPGVLRPRKRRRRRGQPEDPAG